MQKCKNENKIINVQDLNSDELLELKRISSMQKLRCYDPDCDEVVIFCMGDKRKYCRHKSIKNSNCSYSSYANIESDKKHISKVKIYQELKSFLIY